MLFHRLKYRMFKRFISAGIVGLLGLALPCQAQRLAPPLEDQRQLPIKDSSAEVLYSITKADLKKDGRWRQTVYVSVRVNDLDAARDYGRITIRFNHYYSDVSLEFANTISKEGKIESVSRQALQRRVTGGGQDFYSDSSDIVFSLPDISPGSVLEFQYLRESKVLAIDGLYSDRAYPFWYQNTAGQDGWRADFVHHYEYGLISQRQQRIFTKAYSGYPERAKTKIRGGNIERLWTMTDVKGVRSEHWMPNAREFLPSLGLSTMNDWSTINDWTWSKIKHKLAPTDRLKRIVQQLKLSPDASNEEKVRAVYGYLQNNIRYVFAHLGRGGYEPHAPDEVLKVNYGDCKDQSVLAVALLRMLGVNAFPALVETPRSGDADTSIVSLIFDHMMVHIPASENVSTLWLDTTGDRTLYPGVSHYFAGQNAMIVNDSGGQMTKIPNLGVNQANVDVRYYLDNNNISRASVTVRHKGYFEQNVRSWLVHSNDREHQINQYLGSLFISSAVKEFVASSSDITNLWQSVELRADFEFHATNEREVSYGASLIQGLNLFSSLSSLPKPKHRKTPFYDKYPYEIVMNFSFDGNAKFIPALVQSHDDINSPYFSLHHSNQWLGKQYHIAMHFKRHRLNLSLPNYADYFASFKQLERGDIWLVRLFKDRNVEREGNVLTRARHFGKESIEYLMTLSRQYIRQGKFSDALKPAQQAVDSYGTSGEAWYVLGLAQGFNALIDESNESFSQAEKLGYIPSH